jgi:molybdopterin-synthase adenylyltransferase
MNSRNTHSSVRNIAKSVRVKTVRVKSVRAVSTSSKLSTITVCVIGLGTLGSAVAKMLVHAGVKELTLIDRDIVEKKNLFLQPLYQENDVGLPKALVAKARLQKFAKHTKITALPIDLTRHNINEISANILVDATDNLESRFLLNDYARKNRIPLVFGAVQRNEGYVFVVEKDKKCPCLRCWLPFSKKSLSCETTGVAFNAASKVSTLQFKLVRDLARKKHCKHAVLYVRANHKNNNTLEKIRVQKNPYCPCCNARYEFLDSDMKVSRVCSDNTVQVNLTFDYVNAKNRVKKKAEFLDMKSCFLYKELIVFPGRILVKTSKEPNARWFIQKYLGL